LTNRIQLLKFLIFRIVSIIRLILLKILYRRYIFFKRFKIYIPISCKIKIFGEKAVLKIGNNFSIRRYSDIEVNNGNLLIGDNVFFNKNLTIVCRSKIEIGDNCQFGNNISIYDHDHIFNSIPFEKNKFIVKPIYIGNNVWIGCHSFIGKGVTIGDNVVIGAGSVITKNIPSNSVYINGKIKQLIIEK